MNKFFKKTLFILLSLSLLTGCSGKDSTSVNQTDAHISMAQKFIEQNDYDSALVILEEALKLSDSNELKLLYNSVVKLSKNQEDSGDIASSLLGQWYLGGPEAFMADIDVYISKENDSLIIKGKYNDYVEAPFEFNKTIKSSDIADGYELLDLCDNYGKVINAEIKVIDEVIGNKSATYIKCTHIAHEHTLPDVEYTLYNKTTGTMLEGVHLIKAYCDAGTEYIDRASVLHGGNILNMSLDKNLLTLNYTSVMPGSGEMAEINHVTDLSELKYSEEEYSYYLEFPYTDNLGATGNVKFTFGAGNGGHMIYVDVFPSNTKSEAWSIASTAKNFPLLERYWVEQ